MMGLEVSTGEVILEARGITKSFGNIIANNNIDFKLRRGEIHALLGENGAGKTTLCSILYGFMRPDKGEIILRGKPVRFNSPKDAIRNGIGMVHQELMLIPNMSVTENLSLIIDIEYGKLILDLDSVKRKLLEMEQLYGLPVDPDAKVEELSVGERQRIEILKSLFVGAEILLFDEPTSYLTEIETEKLFESLKLMTKEGKSIVFVTHKIDEVMAIADKITVLKQGKVVATRRREEVSKKELAKLIVGREVLYRVQKVNREPGEVLLELKNVSVKSDGGSQMLRNVSLSVRAGEIVGVAGVAGNGQRELDEVITGMRRVTSGRILINGNDVTNLTADQVRRIGVAHICEEHKTGFILNFDLKKNLILPPYISGMFTKGIFIDEVRLRDKLNELLERFNISAPSIDAPLWTLSGGNKQKFLLARELFWEPKVIVANNPTKGLDIAAAEYIRNVLMEQKSRGRAILMISSDIDELIDMSDKIAVLNRGRIMKVFNSEEINLHEIAYLMTTSS